MNFPVKEIVLLQRRTKTGNQTGVIVPQLVSLMKFNASNVPAK